MKNKFSIVLKHKSTVGRIDHSKSNFQCFFKGITVGLALKYVVKGEEIYYINDKIIPVPEGNFILLRPNIDFEASTEKRNNATQGICIDLSMTLPKLNLKKELLNNLIYNRPFNLSNSTLIGKELNLISSSIQDQDEINNESLFRISNQLIAFSKNIVQYKKQIFSMYKKEETHEFIIHKLLLAKEYIISNYRERIRLDELSRHTAMSKFQLIRLFDVCFNCSPLKMQSILRMEEAKYLLQENKDSISKIAFDLGYFDIAAFSKKFKSYFGVAPSSFKK